MKETIISIIVVLTLSLSTVMVSHAQEATPTPDADSFSDQINNLKEKIASRVAELQIVEKRGIVGEVEEVEGNEITLADLQGDTRIVDVDEITEFIGEDDEDFGISDITPGMRLSILGRYNKDSERLLARFVEVVSIPEYLSGKVTEKNASAFSFVITDSAGVQTSIDVETVTRTQEYTEEDGLVRSGFSDLEENDYVVVTGFPDSQDNAIIDATRILILRDLSAPPVEESSPTTPVIDDEE